VPLVKIGPVASVFKSGRGVAAGVGFITGFLVALLIFGEPWHLPPDWGDIPTWLTAVFAAVAGVVALRQLTILRQQVADEMQQNSKRDAAFKAESALNVKRDKLIGSQLAEAERRAIADRRTQAEDVEITWVLVNNYINGVVENKSRRPITNIACKVMSNVDRSLLKLPDKSGERQVLIGSNGRMMHFTPEFKPLATFGMLRPQATCTFVFDELKGAPDQVFVAWFTDDAGFRWQLDEYLHLVQVKDDEEHVYRKDEDPYALLSVPAFRSPTARASLPFATAGHRSSLCRRSAPLQS
jgi:hypothetical protein